MVSLTKTRQRFQFSLLQLPNYLWPTVEVRSSGKLRTALELEAQLEFRSNSATQPCTPKSHLWASDVIHWNSLIWVTCDAIDWMQQSETRLCRREEANLRRFWVNPRAVRENSGKAVHLSPARSDGQIQGPCCTHKHSASRLMRFLYLNVNASTLVDSVFYCSEIYPENS